NEAMEFTESKEFTINHVLSVLSATELVEISNESKEDLEMIIEALRNPTAHIDFVRSVVARMLNSSGMKSPAILRGHFHFAGHYSECAQIDYKVGGRERNFKGAYFRTYLDPLLRPNSRNDSCTLDFPYVHILGIEEYGNSWSEDFVSTYCTSEVRCARAPFAESYEKQADSKNNSYPLFSS
ncbi:hypothetical protein PRIPAC_79684, partial [Pristionchus pacificus]|uniref:Nose resistant-to-fluoxetine protein N-terminal domain-containing protein n=1 Tax=Pristionchus pacificus TaxID=54126 RepID=A0A2A6C226_PRIPA